MANLWLDLKGPILADTVYIGGTLVAKDVTISLPAVTPVTADFKAMGTYTAPILGQIEAMEASITKIGIDLGLRDPPSQAPCRHRPAWPPPARPPSSSDTPTDAPTPDATLEPSARDLSLSACAHPPGLKQERHQTWGASVGVR